MYYATPKQNHRPYLLGQEMYYCDVSVYDAIVEAMYACRMEPSEEYLKPYPLLTTFMGLMAAKFEKYTADRGGRTLDINMRAHT